MDDRLRELAVENWVEKIIESVRDISHGSVEIVVQDSKVIQINKVEKIRLAQKNGNERSGKGTIPPRVR